MKLKFVTLILFLTSMLSLLAQCPFGNGTKINCIHGCGRFIDSNNDNFCDNGKVEQSVEIQKDIIIIAKDSAKTDISNVPDKIYVTKTGQRQTETKQINVQTLETRPITQAPVIEASESDGQTSAPYPVILISGSVLVLYIFTMVLVKTGSIRKITHRRIWNTILLISFLLSCIGGFYLVLQLNYRWTLDMFPLLLKIHVWSGIVMALIGFIHILWHLTYFKRIVKPNRQTK